MDFDYDLFVIGGGSGGVRAGRDQNMLGPEYLPGRQIHLMRARNRCTGGKNIGPRVPKVTGINPF